MKHTLRFTVALLLLATMILGCSVVALAAADVEQTIEIKDEATMVKDVTYDLEGNTEKVANSPSEDLLRFGDSIRGGRVFAYNEIIAYKDPANSFITNSFGTGVGDNTTNSIAISYAVGAESYKQTELRIKTAKLIKDYEFKNSSEFVFTPVVYDYVSFSFDLFLQDNPRNFYVRLSNTPEAVLMYIDAAGDIWLRGEGGGTSTDPNEDFDVKIGHLPSGDWTTFEITFFPKRGTVGYYDYSIVMDGQTLTEDGSMYIVAGIVDDADFQMDATLLTLGVAPSPTPITKACTWAVDNIGFKTYAYTGDPADVEADIPAVNTVSGAEFVDVWSSSDWSADSILNIRAGMTLINTNFAVQLPGVTGATAVDPDWQKKGSYTSADYTLSLGADGVLTVNRTEGGTVKVPLYKNNGNINLSAATITPNFRVAFTFISNSDGTLALTLGEAALSVPVSAGANEIVLTVKDGKVLVGDVEQVGVVAPTPSATLALEIALPAGQQVGLADFSVAEEQTANKYTIQLNGETVEINAARANYLIYLAAKKAAAPDVVLKAKDYNTLDRRAVRPVGDIIFHSTEFYYDPEVKLQVNSWGTSVNNAWTNEVTYWSTNKSAIDEETGDPEKGYETNGYLCGYWQLYMEDGAFVSKINKADQFQMDKNGFYMYTQGIQANMMKEQGMKDRMEQEYASEYFLYGFSIWYDPVTFPAGVDDKGNRRVVSVRLGQRGSVPEADENGETPEIGPDVVGDHWLRGQLLFEIDGDGMLIIPSNRYGTDLIVPDNAEEKPTYTPMASETVVQLEEGWNTIDMLFKKEALWVGEEYLEGNGKNGPINVTQENTHAYFTMQYTINGDTIFHNPADEDNGMNFIFDNGRDPCTQGVYLDIQANIYSYGIEQETELERLKIKDWKYEFCSDQEIDVNCYIKGTSGSEILAFTDFTEQDGRTDPKAFANEAGAVTFTNQNERLLVDHKAAGSEAKVGYFFESDLLADGPVAFDFSLYTDSTAPVVTVGSGATTLVSVENGFVSVMGNVLATTKKSGWNELAVIFEKAEDKVLLTAYVQGEIVLFRAQTSLTEVKDVYVASAGDAGKGYKLDNLAIAHDIVPTSIVYMMPVTYINEGQTSAGAYEDIHFIGADSTLFPTGAKEGAVFEGWYFDAAFTSRAKRIKASYTKPVVLYAKYNYQVSYTMGNVGGTTPGSQSTYGEIVMPYQPGVAYWHAVVEGKDVYYTPGSVFKVEGNVRFEALTATEAANADFVLSVDRIDPAANYETVYNLVYGLAADPDNEIEQIVGCDEYYALADAADPAVITAKAALELIRDSLEAKDQAAAEYLAQLAKVTDTSKTYAERYAAFKEMNIDQDADGKTWRQRMDGTVPGIFEANSQLIAYTLSFERAREAAIELALACEALAAGTADFVTLTRVGKAYNYCYDTAEISLVSTYVYDNEEELAGIADLKTVSEYLVQAKAQVDAYNAKVAVYNSEFVGVQAAAGSISHKLTAAMAIKAAVDQFSSDVALVPGRED